LQADSSYQNTDLRKDLEHLGEMQAECLKKDEFNNRLKSVWDGMKELHDNASSLAVLKDRAALTEQQLCVAGKNQLGIYTLKEDTLMLCFAFPGETDRPTKLESSKDSKSIQLVLKREKK
jgi:hypothetical protein